MPGCQRLAEAVGKCGLLDGVGFELGRQAIRQQGLESAKIAPGVEKLRIFQKVQQESLVIAFQADHAPLAATGDDAIQYLPRGGAAIDVVTKENLEGVLRRCPVQIGIDK